MKHIPLIVLGAGGVGRALLNQIINGRSQHAARNQCQLNVVAVADSRSYRWQPAGLDDMQLAEIISRKEAGEPAAAEIGRPENEELVETAVAAGLENAILVDVTAEAGMEGVIDRALSHGYGVVLANKKPLAGPWAVAQRYFGHPRLRHESTVGGGQPVIATLRYLLDVADPIHRISGHLSGSLGYICARLDEGASFSQAIAEAKANGYTEPDPRDDLGGRDVMRKILILGRMAGWPLETDALSIESLYPAELADLSVSDFMQRISALDGEMAARVAAAARTGKVLRYVAEVSEGTGRVSLQEIPAHDPLANMKYISFRSDIYHDEPLIIGGKGAGVGMTAAGALGDVMDLAREM